MSQQVHVSFALTFRADAQRFASSNGTSQAVAGVAVNGGYSFGVEGGATILSRVLQPLNADFSTGSGIGNEGFKFESFPGMEDGAGHPIADANGLPLDFSTLTVLCLRVRAIDPSQEWGGTVNITTSGVVPGDSFGRTGIAADALLIHQDAAGWTPDGSGSILVEFVPTTAPLPTMVNAMVEMLVIGKPAPEVIPSFTVNPSITGTAIEGATLTAASGTFSGTPAPVDGYQWVRCNVGGDPLADIPGATGNAYDLTSAEIGFTVRVRQIARNSAGTGSALSSHTAVVTT